MPGRGKALVDTDISMAVPAGTCMFCLLDSRLGAYQLRANLLASMLMIYLLQMDALPRALALRASI